MLVKISDGSPVQIPYVDAGGNQYPPNMEAVWTDEQLAAIGLRREPDPAPLPPVPSCTDLQFRLALNQLGLRDAVDAYVARASQDVKDWWDRAITIHADHPLLLQAATALGKTQADIEAVIVLGKTLS